jgi:hypothetical protein
LPLNLRQISRVQPSAVFKTTSNFGLRKAQKISTHSAWLTPSKAKAVRLGCCGFDEKSRIDLVGKRSSEVKERKVFLNTGHNLKTPEGHVDAFVKLFF